MRKKTKEKRSRRRHSAADVQDKRNKTVNEKKIYECKIRRQGKNCHKFR